MIANVALLAGLTTFLLAGWLAGELRYLAPYKRAIFTQYGWQIGALTLLVFFNLCGWFYLIARWMFLRDASRKLTHVDRQLESSSGIHQELRHHLRAKRR